MSSGGLAWGHIVSTVGTVAPIIAALAASFAIISSPFWRHVGKMGNKLAIVINPLNAVHQQISKLTAAADTRADEAKKQYAAIMAELKPNGGGSLRDAIDVIGARSVLNGVRIKILMDESRVGRAEADANGPCRFTIETLRKNTPARMSAPFQAALAVAANRHAPDLAVRMPSGAIHDAQMLSTVMPAAMMFVPSIGGISHHWSENTADDDIVLGARVFATWAAGLLGMEA